MALLPPVRHAAVLPVGYRVLFVFVEPLVIWGALASIVAAPANHFHSLAPQHSAGLFFTHSPRDAWCTQPAALNTPQLRAMLYQFMGALAFSAIIEPLVLYVAAYRLESARDAERVVTAVLVAFAAFDVLHSGATIAVTGLPALLPASISGHAGALHLEAAINFWLPLVWLGIRSSWFLGIGRESTSKLKRK